MSDFTKRVDDILVSVMVDGWDFDLSAFTPAELCIMHDRVRVELYGERKPTTYAKGWFTCGSLKYRRDDIENTVKRHAVLLSEKRERKVPDAERRLRNTLRFANGDQLRLIMKGLSAISVQARKDGNSDEAEKAERLLALCPGLPLLPDTDQLSS